MVSPIALGEKSKGVRERLSYALYHIRGIPDGLALLSSLEQQSLRQQEPQLPRQE